MKIIISICLFSVLIFYNLSANLNPPNTASIAGFVRDERSKETLISATVMLKDTKLGTRTNKNGFYSISSIPPGSYTLVVSFLGYERFERKITLKANEELRLDISLKE
ncbi:MAG TPA: carboxypeptidase-like regulatory domain-containing protein, partial [Candidatus Kapabacteria bacterium]|nr:carboxypeptidase-like regulatory domain-containing protein [Candidatus Kapabacteria bacterium]